MKKLLSTAIAAGLFISMNVSPACAQQVLNSATNGSVDFNGNYTNEKVIGGNGTTGTFIWDKFDVESNETFNIEFTNHNQTALNLVNASGGMSHIYGNITNSGCSGCGYADTGKVILINPNGVLFGNGANVNLNSFTVSTLDGSYDSENKQLVLEKGSNSKAGIYVMDGANIYGDKNVTFASNNITQYSGSKISTNIDPNVGSDSYGKVKLVTTDGVTFTYYNNGAVRNVSDITTSTDKMVIQLNGEINSGHIDVRNYSTDTDSEINLKGATLKATKAVSGNDGNIWLTASNKVVIEDSTLKSEGTTNMGYSTATSLDGNSTVSIGISSMYPIASGGIKIAAGNEVSIDSSTLKTGGNSINISSKNSDVIIDNTSVDTQGNTLGLVGDRYGYSDLTIAAGGIASIQNGSTIQSGDTTITGGKRTQVVDSTVITDGIDMTGENIWISDSNIQAYGASINAEATNGNLLAQNSYLASGVHVYPYHDTTKSITLKASGDLTTEGLNVSNSQTNLYSGNNINAELSNVANKDAGLVAEAQNNVTITTDGTLSVSKLVAKNGNMTINADKVIAGLPYTDEEKISGDDSERSYIYVANGTFTSNTTSDSYEVTASDTATTDGNYQMRHHIQYGDGEEKILLITKIPNETQDKTQSADTPQKSNTQLTMFDEDQSKMLNKLPRRPESYNN
ncbi:MAG: filamentous hemagglutinin N-terminal domain-containing protein, partial [Candidatus Gastranaerophilales bacterium]|nr:filamentous hemagglutinin N-terminal domain-containing protein [Candidatus Gastranaerophilales bacterium]